MSEIEKIEEVDKLTAKQLKGILINNFVNYRGCKERHELITKVKMLWESRQANKQLYEKIVNQAGVCHMSNLNLILYIVIYQVTFYQVENLDFSLC